MTGARTPPSARRRGWLLAVAKLLGSVLLIGFVLSRLSLEDIRQAMNDPHWGYLLAALVVYGISALAGAVQWTWILHVAGVPAPPREVRRIYFIGLFFNNFLPANIGGDAWKIIDLGRQHDRRLGVFCATLLDRLIGLGALAAQAVIVLAIASLVGIPLPSSALLMIPTLLALTGLLALLLSRRLGRLLPGTARRLGQTTLAERLGQLTAEFARYRPRVRWLNGIFLFSVGVQTLRMVTHLLVAYGLGFRLEAAQMVQLMVLVPLLAIALTLPITINGIGLRESISASLLTWAGMAAPEAVAMEVAAYLVQVVFSLQGGVLLWMGRWGKGQRRA